MVVGGGEDDGAVDADGVEDAEGEAVGQVYVEEDQVGMDAAFEVFDTFLDTLEDAVDLGVGDYVVERALEVLGGDGLVFNDEDMFHIRGISTENFLALSLIHPYHFPGLLMKTGREQEILHQHCTP